jgi:enediyne biosynthesis protein E4
MIRRETHRLVAVVCVAWLSGCKPSAPPAPPLFELLSPEATGVTFANTIPEDDTTFNIINYLYYYNGGGVAVGDIDGDGLPDLYFSANEGPNKLYRNKGNYQFEDVTARAGVVGPPGWKTGVSMADVNGDGKIDIFVSAVSYLTMDGHNVLYINNGDGTFTDRTKEFGLAFAGYSTQALFFDYDGDGDLDMYLLNHSTHSELAAGKGSPAQRAVRHPRAGDRLYRNDGNHFVDVSEQAGIYGGVEGFGLGVVASDFNLDGCPDLYVSNDFQENDFLYINNCDGTFTESIGKATGHTSRFSMGVDAADFNNDGRPDILVADMLPEREEIRKSSASTERYSLFNLRVQAGYHPQYERNTLQLNFGGARFGDVASLAGVSATDWSWSPLFADLDNDGYKDLFLSDGVYRRPNDLDYIDYISNDAVQASLATGVTRENLKAILDKLPHVPLANHVFHNNGRGDLAFTNVAQNWGLTQTGFSNGAVYVDLNNSGNLDLVVNRLNAPAAIYRNHARELNRNAYLTINLAGAKGNTAGIGAKVMIAAHGTHQLLEQMPTRGFESSVDSRLHFGLGKDTIVDSLTVVWPDRQFQVLTHVKANQRLTLLQSNASGKWVFDSLSRGIATKPLFEDVTKSTRIDYRHQENLFVDYDREPLMPHLVSREGPALAVADVNGDGLDDIFVGGAKWQRARLYLQQRDGSFRETVQPAIAADSLDEDVDAAFFDADGDGHPDLFVVSAGNEFWGDADALSDRLYLNDGAGHFRRASDALPAFFDNGSCVVPGDFDGDGHVDLFVGGRVVSRAYGLAPRSHLLRNDGRGHFTDVTTDLAPTLANIGMVTGATWVDYDGDGKLDLVVVGEWMPVRVFHQEQGRFVDRTDAAGLSRTEGWWNTVTAVDLDGDGHKDLVLGNLGLNSFLHATPDAPVRMYVYDFFHTGSLKQILTFDRNGASYPLASRDELAAVMPEIGKRFATHAEFGSKRIEDILPSSALRDARVLVARTFATSIAINRGNGTFELRSLPAEAQLAPVNAVVARDFDGDGRVDLLLAGNSYGEPPVLGQYDASHGLLLRGVGNASFEPVDAARSGVWIDGKVRHLAVVHRAGAQAGDLVAVARNDTTLELLRINAGRANDAAANASRSGVRERVDAHEVGDDARRDVDGTHATSSRGSQIWRQHTRVDRGLDRSLHRQRLGR